MILTKTPLRISFFGGGTDYPECLSSLPDGGCTLSTTIDKYSYLSLAPLTEFFDFRYRISYSKIELTQSIDEIEHASVRECLRFLDIERPLELHSISDLPARTGLGSSSSFTVSLLHALHTYRGRFVSPRQLAEEAVHVERERIRERVGLQDQYACAYGGFLHMRFLSATKVEVDKVPLNRERREALEQRLLLFYTGIRRSAHEVLEEQMERVERKELDGTLSGLAGLVSRALDILCSDRSLDEFGRLLGESWALKRSMSSRVSSGLIDGYYAAALSAGALGGKLLGAGGGGFILLYVPPEAQTPVRDALHGLREVSFRFASAGSQVIFTSD